MISANQAPVWILVPKYKFSIGLGGGGGGPDVGYFKRN